MTRLPEQDRIQKIIQTLRQSVKKFQDPSVTMVSKRWQDPFLVLVSCMLSLRTKDTTTIPASERLFLRATTPQGMLNLRLSEIESLIYPVGFFRTKARNIKRLCQNLVKNFNSQVPNKIDILLTFNGVGRKTANLVLTEGFGQPGICVDTHVHRISNRLGYVQTKDPDQTEQALRKKLPKKFWIEYNFLFVMWGQNICRPISPKCSQCAVTEFCPKKNVASRR